MPRYLIAIADIPSQISAILAPFAGDRILLMAAIMVLVVIVGTALDFIPTILILTPILMPIVKQAGIDPVYFGVLFIMNNAIGLITPPVGTVLNVVGGSRADRPWIGDPRGNALPHCAADRAGAARRLPGPRYRPCPLALLT